MDKLYAVTIRKNGEVLRVDSNYSQSRANRIHKIAKDAGMKIRDDVVTYLVMSSNEEEAIKETKDWLIKYFK